MLKTLRQAFGITISVKTVLAKASLERGILPSPEKADFSTTLL